MCPFDFTCIQCGGKMVVSKQYGKIQCTACGRFIDGTYPPEDAPETLAIGGTNTDEETPVQRWHMGGVRHRGSMSVWTRSLVGRLQAQLYNGDRDGALATCQQLLDMDRDFIDAHQWIALLTDDPERKRKHLDYLLAIDPTNPEARREMMLLRGEITPEEAARAADLYRQNLQPAEGATATETDVLLCPVCLGRLEVDERGGVRCSACGYAAENTDSAKYATAATAVDLALIKQRGKAVRWQVGERLLHCEQCGAERILPATQLSAECPFCGSQHIIVQDALEAFRQPDGLLKFRVNKAAAADALEQALNSTLERLKGVFNNNRVASARYYGVFLPFWAFDVFGTVRISDKLSDNSNNMSVGVQRTEHAEQLMNALIPAVKSPPPSLLYQILPYALDALGGYTPQLLAKFAAELYSVDFDKASMEARAHFRENMLNKYPNRNPNITRSISTQINYMDMQLLLLPVWVVRLIEQDGEHRTALINGQTGKVALGRASKPKPPKP